MLFCWPYDGDANADAGKEEDKQERESHHHHPLQKLLTGGKANIKRKPSSRLGRNPFADCLPKKQFLEQQEEENEDLAVAREGPVLVVTTTTTMTTTNSSASSSVESPPSPLRLRDLDSRSGMSSSVSQMDGNTSFGSTTEDDQISAGALTPSVSNCYYGSSSSIRGSLINKISSSTSLNNTTTSWLLEEQDEGKGGDDSTRGGDESLSGDSWEPIVPDLEEDEEEEAKDEKAAVVVEPVTPACVVYKSKPKETLEPVTPPPSVILSHKMVISPPSPPPASPPQQFFNKPKSIPQSETLKPSARVQRYYNKDATPTKNHAKNPTKAFLVLFVAALLFGVLGAAGFWDNLLNLQQPQPPLATKKATSDSATGTTNKSYTKAKKHRKLMSKPSLNNTTPTSILSATTTTTANFNVTGVQQTMNYLSSSIGSFSGIVNSHDEVVIDDSVFDLSPVQLADAATNGPLLSKKPSTRQRRRRRRSSRTSGRLGAKEEMQQEEEEEEEEERGGPVVGWVAERYQRLNVYVLGQSQLAQLKRKQFQFGQSGIGSLA